MAYDQLTHGTHELPGNVESDELHSRLLKVHDQMCCIVSLLVSASERSRRVGTMCHPDVTAVLLQ